MKSSVAFTAAVAVATANAAALPEANQPRSPEQSSSYSSWSLKQFTSLVIFGDSYSDDSRLVYFINNTGQAPPVGWDDPVNPKAADGGRIWGEYVKQYTSPHINLYNYAVSGAVCSNQITPRYLEAIDGPFPAVEGYEVPAYIADSKFVEPNGEKFMRDPPDRTVYAMWDGTNDLGNGALLQDAQVKGTDITTYVDCIYNQLHRVYMNGARYFVLFNNAPLNLAPLYAAPPFGVGPNQYWADKPKNHSGISGRMEEQVVTTNALFDYRTPYAVEVAKRFPGVSFAVFDVHGLMTDIYNNPADYLNGTAALNVTGYINHCNTTGGNCVANPSPDSFLWYDELHPSEQTERVIARTFVDVVKGGSKWATYWSS